MRTPIAMTASNGWFDPAATDVVVGAGVPDREPTFAAEAGGVNVRLPRRSVTGPPPELTYPAEMTLCSTSSS